MMRTLWRRVGPVCCLLSLCLCVGGARATPPKPFSEKILDDSARLDVNELDMFMTNWGSIAHYVAVGDPGLIFPIGTEMTVMHAAGIWIGAKVDGSLRVSAAGYATTYKPGKILPSGLPADLAEPGYQLYKIEYPYRDSEDYQSWPCGDGAPCLPDGTPWFVGGQTIWSVYNDISPERSSLPNATAEGLGVEIQQTTFGFGGPRGLSRALFVRFRIVNPPTGSILQDAYLSFWADPDLGGAGDDLVGCDTTLSLGYCYNSTNTDIQYGSSPPAVGIDLLQGPIVPSPGDTAYVDGRSIPGHRNLPLTSFNKHINGTDPETPEESYNFMQGLQPDGNPVIDPTTLHPTRFSCPGDPVANTGWTDSNPADRRMMLSSGPFNMAPGETQTVVYAIVVGRQEDRLASIRNLRYNDSLAQAAYDVGFNLDPIQYVLPGDAGHDGTVDARDILPIGLYYDLTGPKRPGGSLEWDSQVLLGAWNPIEAGHADCDGNGRVDALDVLGIIENWNSRFGLPRPAHQDRRRTCLELLAAIDGSSASPGMPQIRSVLREYLDSLPTEELECRLAGNQPNPFRGSTSWALTVAAGIEGRFSIFDPGGRLVWRTTFPAGPARSTPIHWDGTTLLGHQADSGVYYYRLDGGDSRFTGKALRLR